MHAGALEQHFDNGIFWRHWPVADPEHIIVLVHGLGEHSGRYEDFAEFFNSRKIAVVALDHTGHGLSPGTRCHVSSFEDYLSPLLALTLEAEALYPGVPKVLIGHSLGGLIAAAFLLSHQDKFQSAVLSGPALGIDPAPPVWQQRITRALSYLLPKLGVLALDASQVSRSTEVVAAYQADPLVHHGKISARLVTELFDCVERVNDQAGRILLPLKIVHGEADVMTSPQASKAFIEKLGSEVAEYQGYPGLYHEIFNEPEREQVLEDVLSFIGRVN
jgi:alpha-beta hydrolase superfamily lysophospholipase